MTAPPSAEKKPPKSLKLPKLPRPTQADGLKRLKLTQVIIAVLLIFSVFMWVQYHDAQNKLSGSTMAKQDSSVIADVRKLAVVPANETPTVATVVNASKLQDQTFFANAKNGDKVLVFNREKEAILYRPSSNQIVTIAPVTVSPSVSNLTGQ